MYRDAVFAGLTKLLARLLLPMAALRFGRQGARWGAAQWALGLRFPAEDLRGLQPGAHHAFTWARTEALWRDGQLVGLTSGHRDAAVQHRMFVEEQQRASSALPRVLPPELSPHVRGTAVDVRPREGARWLEAHGWRYGLYRTYDNEWWHFEHHPHERPPRLPHPGVRMPTRQPSRERASSQVRLANTTSHSPEPSADTHSATTVRTPLPGGADQHRAGLARTQHADPNSATTVRTRTAPGQVR